APLAPYQEQRPVVQAPKHASEASAIKIDSLQHLTAFANAHTTLVRHVCVPDRVVRIEADAVGNAVAQASPHPPVRQVSFSTNIESGELSAVRFSDNQRSVVRRHGHTIWKSDAVGNLSN